jgi:hypothetical protein
MDRGKTKFNTATLSDSKMTAMAIDQYNTKINKYGE